MNWFSCVSKLSLKCCLERSDFASHVELITHFSGNKLVFLKRDHVLIIYFLIKVEETEDYFATLINLQTQKKSEKSIVILLL